MPTIKSLEDQGRELLAQQKRLVTEDKRPWRNKKSEFEARQKDIDAVLAQHAALKSVDGRGYEGLGGLDGANPFAGLQSGPRGAYAGLLNEGFKACGTPQIQLSPDGVRDLHTAAVERRSLALSAESKAADTSATISPATISDFRLPTVSARREPTRVLSLVPCVGTSMSSITYYQLTGTTGAAAVAEGALKPTSTLAAAAVTVPIVKIAHLAELTDEVVKDAPSFMATAMEDMFAGVVFQENNQILNGSGTAPAMRGLLNTSGILTRARSTDSNLDALEQSVDDLRVGASFAEPDGVVLHPTSYGVLKRTKDTTGQYLLTPDVTMAANPSLFGIKVVLSTQIPVGTALIGDFMGSTIGFIREGIRLETNASSDTNWTKNTVSLRAEERLVVGVVRPSGLLKLTGIA